MLCRPFWTTIPLTRIALSLLPSNSTRQKISYMKLNVEEWTVESTRTELDKVWKVEMRKGMDPIINWELGQRSIKNTLKSTKRVRDDREKNRIRLEDQLFELRNQIGSNPNAAQVQHLVDLEGEVHRWECANATLQQIRSKSSWMKIGDSPSQYFFKLVQAKRIQESIKILSTLDGGSTKDKEEILRGVYNHCRCLYVKDHQVELYSEQRDGVLSLIDKKFVEEDNHELRAVLDEYEITRVVFGFPFGKSPRGDGITYDFFVQLLGSGGRWLCCHGIGVLEEWPSLRKLYKWNSETDS